MTKLSFWIDSIGPTAIKIIESRPILPTITEVKFLRHIKSPSADTLYIADAAEALALLLSHDTLCNMTLFVSGSCDQLQKTAKEKKINLIHSSLDIVDLFENLSKRLWEYKSAHDRTGTEFCTLLKDLVENHLSNEQEIHRRFSMLSRIVHRFCSFVIIESEQSENYLNPDIFNELEKIFPDSNIAEYRESIVILLSRPDRMFQPSPIFDYEQLQAILTHYNAFAAMSNATSQHNMLHTCYTLAKRTLQLGKALRSRITERIFYFEDYAEYFMIDLCLSSFSELLGHDDIIYLAHPDAIKLARYDHQNNTSLLDVLYHYCLSNENIVKTAQSAYMHRNTVTTKIAKIRQLILADLSDGQIRQRMIFSYKILKYYAKYLGIDIEEKIKERKIEE